MYYYPLASGYWKFYGEPLSAFWCCTGTGAEEFAKAGDSIYFHDDAGIFVNLFIPSEVRWPENGVRLRQETSFPDEDTTRLVFDVDRPVAMTLRVRVPWWATRGGTVKLNGRRPARVREPLELPDADAHLEDGRPGRSDAADVPLGLPDARRSDRPGRDVRAARAGRPPRKRGPDARDDLRGVRRRAEGRFGFRRRRSRRIRRASRAGSSRCRASGCRSGRRGRRSRSLSCRSTACSASGTPSIGSSGRQPADVATHDSLLDSGRPRSCRRSAPAGWVRYTVAPLARRSGFATVRLANPRSNARLTASPRFAPAGRTSSLPSVGRLFARRAPGKRSQEWRDAAFRGIG